MVAAAITCDGKQNRFCRKNSGEISNRRRVIHISTNSSRKNVVVFLKTPVFRRPHVLNDPVNHIDPSGKSPILFLLCSAYNLYDIAQTAADLKKLDAEIAATKAAIEDARRQQENGQCPDQDIGDLQQQFLDLQSQRVKASGKGVLKGFITEAICTGLGAI